MNIKEAIKQLDDLKNDFEDFESVEPTITDIQALEIAIKALRALSARNKYKVATSLEKEE